MFKKINNSKNGFTLTEALVGAAIFIILALSVYQAYVTTMDVVRVSRLKITATALANEQFEIMRNLPYEDVGIVNGLPLGKVPYSQNLTRDGKDFVVKTTIRNIDDAFDGTLGGTPSDSSPADYKLAELEISCPNCRNFPTINLATYIAPQNLESASTNGAIFIKVFDADGLPVSNASVHIENNLNNPTFEINDVTNNEGLLQIVDAPPGFQAYEVSVTKSGYTTDQTYASTPENPTPSRPHSTVLVQQLTQTSFTIDELSTLNIESVASTCLAISNVDFTLQSSKLIGTEPDIYKYNESKSTDELGLSNIDDLEWDTYNINLSDADYNLLGIIPATPLVLEPGATQDLKLIVIPDDSKSLLIKVTDSTGLSISGASVELTGVDYDNTLLSSEGSECLPAGQALFRDLLNNTYEVTISKAGYQTYTNSVSTLDDWQVEEINLISEI